MVVKLIQNILKKVQNGNELEKNDIISLFQTKSAEDLLYLLQTACDLRDGKIKLTSTVHLTNVCKGYSQMQILWICCWNIT